MSKGKLLLLFALFSFVMMQLYQGYAMLHPDITYTGVFAPLVVGLFILGIFYLVFKDVVEPDLPKYLLASVVGAYLGYVVFIGILPAAVLGLAAVYYLMKELRS